MKAAKPIMIQGTASHVGKSILVTALCRIFLQDGYKVAPFKSQNMALNSFVTPEGGEIGRAQAVQAEASGLTPSTLINPVLLKPNSDIGAQVILNGKVLTNMDAFEYHTFKKQLQNEILNAYQKLAEEFDIIVIEGAGSPAEINLKENDIVNMGMAKLVDAPVIITGDIDKGGVFASLVGTMELLSAEERKRVKALHINKFRGDIDILRPGLDFLTNRCRCPLLGVTPYIKDIGIQEEDSLPQDRINKNIKAHANPLKVRVVILPHMSNFTDFDPLEGEDGVQLQYIKSVEDFDDPDLIVLPGTKNTLDDFTYLEKSGFAQQIRKYCEEGVFILGVCGGYQMLGREILDPETTESSLNKIAGLNLLDISTCFKPGKITAQVTAKALDLPFYQGELTGYEIHMGRTKLSNDEKPLFSVSSHDKQYLDGAVRPDFKIMGTYLHGLFDNDAFRHEYLNFIRQKRGLPILETQSASTHKKRQEAYDKLADIVRKSVDMDLVYNIVFNRV